MAEETGAERTGGAASGAPGTGSVAGRNIVVCCDGTGNQYDDKNTNVVKLYETLDLSDPERQVAFYDPGVGTFDYSSRGEDRWLRKLVGKATGRGVRENVCDAYRYLMRTWRPGDRIYIFGFSRGAHTARALSAMIGTVGLLEADNVNLIDYAYDMYKAPPSQAARAGFKRAFSRAHMALPADADPAAHDVPVEMVGVWDTVATIYSLKDLEVQAFSDNVMSKNVRHGVQACAIDEDRGKFRLSLWSETSKDPGQTIEQVWFAGNHGDVGGGWARRGLADIPLVWMLEKARSAGVILRPGRIPTTDGKHLGPRHSARTLFWTLSDIGNGFRADRRFPPDGPPYAGYTDGPVRVHESVRTRMDAAAELFVPAGVHEDFAEERTYAPDLPASIDWVS